MKAVIEKAMKCGFDPYRETLNNFEKHYKIKARVAGISESEGFVFIDYTADGKERDVSGETPAITYMENIYKLIFGNSLGFIECLVGEKRMCTYKRCILHSTKSKNGCGQHINPETTCGIYRGAMSADYHRAQMANIKDVEKLKDYLRGLV